MQEREENLKIDRDSLAGQCAEAAKKATDSYEL